MVFKKFYILTVILFNEFNVYNKKRSRKTAANDEISLENVAPPKAKRFVKFFSFFYH